MAVALSLTISGCGECVFQAPVKGAVIDSKGHALRGARVTACDSEDPPSDADPSCKSVVTNARGQFTVPAVLYRPKAFECAVHSLWVDKPGCRTTKQPLGEPPDEVAITVPCGPNAPPGVAPLATPRVTPPKTGAVAARIEAGDHVVTLEMKSKVAWQPVCTAPCDALLAPGHSYRVRGQGISTSEAFIVSSGQPSLLLAVSPATSKDSVLGQALTYPGLLVTAAGTVTAIAGAVAPSETPSGDDNRGKKDSLVGVGLVTLGVGLVTLVPGIILDAISSETTVKAQAAGIALGPGGLSF